MAAEQYCLKWTNYQRNVTSSFKTLLENEEFVDVTISAEGKSCSAHRVVLSAASPYFRNLLSSLKAWQHPVLVLRDISHIDVTAILEFVYDGKVDVSQDRLQSFLRTAQFLQISGLVEENGSSRCGFLLFYHLLSTNLTVCFPCWQRGAANEGKGLQWRRKAKADLGRSRWQETGDFLQTPQKLNPHCDN